MYLGLILIIVLFLPAVWLIAFGLTFPAYLVAGGPKRGAFTFACWLLVLASIWFVFGLFGRMFLVNGSFNGAMMLIPSALIATLFFVGGGALMGQTLAAMAPIRAPMRSMLLLGAGMGVLGVIGLVMTIQTHHTPGAPVPTNWLMTLLWTCGPVAVFYTSAFAQRKHFRRYLASDCVRCGYGGGSRGERCSECGETPMILCGRCRRFSDRKAGEACPRCNVTLGRRCWRCQYDWKGIESDRCPECGVWKAGDGKGLEGGLEI